MYDAHVIYVDSFIVIVYIYINALYVSVPVFKRY